MKFECKSPRCRDLDLNEKDVVCWRCGSVPVKVRTYEDIQEVTIKALEAMDNAYKGQSNPLWPFSTSQANRGQSNTGATPNPLPEFKPNSSLPVYDKVDNYTLHWEGWRPAIFSGDYAIGSWKAVRKDGAIAVVQNTIVTLEEAAQSTTMPCCHFRN